MLVFVVLTVFLAGLMVGRTPEYLGKKIEAYDVKVSVFCRAGAGLFHPGVYGLGGGERLGHWQVSNNAGPHGLSEILYAYSSAAGNNGSAFAGLERQHALVQHDSGSCHARWAASS